MLGGYVASNLISIPQTFGVGSRGKVGGGGGPPRANMDKCSDMKSVPLAGVTSYDRVWSESAGKRGRSEQSFLCLL